MDCIPSPNAAKNFSARAIKASAGTPVRPAAAAGPRLETAAVRAAAPGTPLRSARRRAAGFKIASIRGVTGSRNAPPG